MHNENTGNSGLKNNTVLYEHSLSHIGKIYSSFILKTKHFETWFSCTRNNYESNIFLPKGKKQKEQNLFLNFSAVPVSATRMHYFIKKKETLHSVP